VHSGVNDDFDDIKVNFGVKAEGLYAMFFKTVANNNVYVLDSLVKLHHVQPKCMPLN